MGTNRKPKYVFITTLKFYFIFYFYLLDFHCYLFQIEASEEKRDNNILVQLPNNQLMFSYVTLWFC